MRTSQLLIGVALGAAIALTVLISAVVLVVISGSEIVGIAFVGLSAGILMLTAGAISSKV